MEDDDKKLHIPIPNRIGDQFKLTSEASAFRAALPKRQVDGRQNGQQSSFSQSLPEREIIVKKEEIRPMQFHIELNLDDPDQPDKPQETITVKKEADSMLQEDNDDDDDDDLFGDKSDDSGSGNRDDGKMLDKRAELENQDDDDLFVSLVNSLGR